MGRAPCCEKVGLKKGPWTPEEDDLLVSYIKEHGHGSWRALPKKAGLLRCGKSCRLRWTNYLRPDIKRGKFSASEEQTILQLHTLLGNRWSAIASHLPKRTDNEIKNYWNTHLKKKLVKVGATPPTHKPLKQLQKDALVSDNTATASNLRAKNQINTDLLLQASCTSITGGTSATASHLAQWESARLEAEARLTQEAKMRSKGTWPHSVSSALPVPSFRASLGWQSFNSIASNGAVGLGAFKALSAVDLMHSLQNWEKSLQGQAMLLWQDAWRLSSNSGSGVQQEGQAESSSCSSPSSECQAKPIPNITAPVCRMDNCSPTSASCSHSEAPQGTLQHKEAAGSTPFASSNNTVKMLTGTDINMPFSSHSPKPIVNDVCKVEGYRETFSSLMLDAVLGRTPVAQPCVSKVDGGCNATDETVVNEGTAEKPGTGLKKVIPKSYGLFKHIDDESSNVLSTCGALLGEMEMELEEEVKRCVDEEEEEEDEKSMGVDGEMMMSGNEVFRDLPKLKKEVATTHVSYMALLSEDISDDWNDLMLKGEPANSPSIHITF